MTIFGIDISHYQGDNGFNLVLSSQSSLVQFVIAKMSEGESTRDAYFQRFRAQAQDRGLLFAGYHYVRGDSSAAAQVRNMKVALGGANVPVILDIERTNGSPQPTLALGAQIREEALQQGVWISELTYVPEWYWIELGRPNHEPFPLWHSRYGVNDGDYFGDNSTYWMTMGREAKILQYTDKGRVFGYPADIDRNAYRGTREQLAKTGWFKDYAAPKEPEVTKEEIQEAVRTTPILVDLKTGREVPLQQVLRRLLDRTPIGAKDISEVIVRKLEKSGALNGNLQSDVIRDQLEDILIAYLTASVELSHGGR